MDNSNKTLAIIPARKGSKRLPGKNMLSFGGKPLIQWSIEAALASNAIDEVAVTTDDDDILELARTLGIRLLVPRPNELASDEAKTSDVIFHALQSIAPSGVQPGHICLLQATSPLRNSTDIDSAFALHHKWQNVPVVSVCEMEHPLAWCNTLKPDGSMSNFAKLLGTSERSQSCAKYYRLNGAIYISTTIGFELSSGFLTEETRAYIMPKARSVDIDDAFDFKVAEALQSLCCS